MSAIFAPIIKTDRHFRAAQKRLEAIFESVLHVFWVSICNVAARRFGPFKTVLRDGFRAKAEKRLATFPNLISSLNIMQDGTTLLLSKKGHIHMCAHAHVWDRLVGHFFQKRLAPAAAPVVEEWGRQNELSDNFGQSGFGR